MTDLKITFSTELRDFDRLQKAINEITKELMGVGKAAGMSSDQMSKLFSSTGEISRGMGALDKAVTQMKSFKGMLDELGKSRLDLNTMTGDLGKLGSVIEKTFGGAQETLLNRFKNSIGQLRQEAERAAQTQQMYEKQADRAKSMGNTTFADMYRLQAQKSRIAAGSLITESRRQQIAMEDTEDQMAYQGSWMAKAEGQARSYGVAALRPMSRMMARAGTSFGGAFGAMGTGLAIAGIAGGIGASLDDWSSLRPERIFQGEQQINYGRLQAAAQGNPTLLAMQRMGVGAEADFSNSTWRGVSAYLRGTTAGNIGRLFNGQPMSFSPTEIFQQESLRRRSVDEAAFSAAYQPATIGLYSRQQQNYSIYKTLGNQGGEQAMQAILQSGISTERMQPLVAAIQNAGGATSADLLASRTRQLYDSAYTYGMSQKAVEQIASRQVSMPGANDAARQALGAGQMQTFQGAQSLSDIQGQFMSTQSYRTGFQGAEYIGALAGQGVMAGMPEPVAAQVGATVAGATQQMVGQRGTLLSASLQSSLMQAGVGNLMQQSIILEMMRTGRQKEAIGMLAKVTGKSPDEAGRIIQGAARAQTNMTSMLLGGGTREMLESQGLGANILFSGDQNLQQSTSPVVGQDLTTAAAASGGPQGPRPQAKTYAPISEDERQRAAAQGEAGVLEYTKKVYDEIVKMVNQGLVIKSTPMEAALNKLADMKAGLTASPQNQAALREGLPFGGTKGVGR